ncbi:MAG: glycosyltransferase family 2 protein [Bacilli bacterium]
MSRVDVLVATYNGEKYIAQQLESIIMQSHKDIRIIISDDCSTDNTRNILKHYKSIDSRIQLILNEKNKGLVANFEQLLGLVTSPYFAFSDQDDIWMLDKLEKQMQIISKGEFNMVISDVLVVDENLKGNEVLLFNNSNFRSKLMKYNDIRLEYISNCAIGCTILAKKEIIEKNLPLPKNTFVIHDYYLAIIAGLTGKIYFIEEPLVKYRQHGNNLIGAGKENFESFQKARESFIQKKIELFTLYKSLNNLFTDKLKKQNNSFLNKLKKDKLTKVMSFKGIILFFNVYKFEPLKVKIKALFILNFPVLIKHFFK